VAKGGRRNSKEVFSRSRTDGAGEGGDCSTGFPRKKEGCLCMEKVTPEIRRYTKGRGIISALRQRKLATNVERKTTTAWGKELGGYVASGCRGLNKKLCSGSQTTTGEKGEEPYSLSKGKEKFFLSRIETPGETCTNTHRKSEARDSPGNYCQTVVT